MKKFFNKTSLICFGIVIVITSVSILGVILSHNENEKIQGNINKVNSDYKNYFNNKNIDYQISTNIKFDIQKNKKLLLFSLTNWNSINDKSQVFFIHKLVNDNLINTLKIIIQDNYLFNKSNNLYINAKYEFKSEKEITIDVRWADRQSLTSYENLTLYWNKLSLKIEDLLL